MTTVATMQPDDLETALLDLDRGGLGDLRDLDNETVAATINRIKEQVERPRANLGSSGPPGRVD